MATPDVVKVILHPVALFGIVDSYERRKEDAKRVIGTLVGNLDKGVVEVKNCFAVPHQETEDEVFLEMEYAANMFDLHKRACPSEDIVGWFATCDDVNEQSLRIHEYYSRVTANPIHLTVDTTLKSGKMNIKAYLSSPMGVPGATIGTIFTPVKCEVTYHTPEAVAIDTFVRNKGGSKKPLTLLSNIQHIARSCDKLIERLGQTVEYVNDVLNGKAAPNNDIGRALMDVVGSVPQMDPDQLEKMLNCNMQDLLMVMYLATLTKTQLSIGTKLNGLI
ncbi:eukaryotic translation initiation factor 3 subunit F-like [Rhopilema esculentum]|uniref:eukaryotic translation initiation factor 3 subunit F-like n=1 Tax=Rhopilema esculentum TaxID=499914 RepID=UPI0031E0BD0F|eukprot:gene6168-11564_t